MYNTLSKNLSSESIALFFSHGAVLAARAATKIFISAYILKLTGSISQVALYFISYYALIPVIMVLIGPLIKKGKLIFFCRLGHISFFAFFVVISQLGPSLVNYVFPVAFAYGLASAFYWLPYNILRVQVVRQDLRKKYYAYEASLEKIIRIIVPLLSGITIWATDSYEILFFSISIFFIVSFLATFRITDDQSQNLDYSIVSLWEHRRANPSLTKLYIAIFLSGFSYLGALDILVVVYIFTSVGSELKLGIISSILPIISIATLLAIGHFLKPRGYLRATFFGGAFIFLGALLLIYQVSYTTALYYSLFYTIGFSILQVTMNIYGFNVIDDNKFLNTHKAEHTVTREIWLCSGRTLGFSLMYIMGTGDTTSIELRWTVLALAFSAFIIPIFLRKLKISI